MDSHPESGFPAWAYLQSKAHAINFRHGSGILVGENTLIREYTGRSPAMSFCEWLLFMGYYPEWTNL